MGRHKGHDNPHGTKGAAPRRNGLEGPSIQIEKLAHRTGKTKKNPLFGKLQGAPPKFTRDLQRMFLKEFQKTGLIQHSADVAGVSRQTVLKYQQSDPVFSLAMENALERYTDILRREVFRRGVEGTLEPVIGGKDKDQVVARIRRYDTTLLMAATRKHDKSYKEKLEVETTNTNKNINANVDASYDQLAKLDPAALEQVDKLLTVLGGGLKQEAKKAAAVQVDDAPSAFTEEDIAEALLPEREDLRREPDFLESTGDEDGSMIGSDDELYDKDGKRVDKSK